MQFTTRKRSNLFPGRGYRQVSEAALGSFEELALEYMPEEEGTMMIYTANQTAEDLNVYMDDMMVMHTEGPIIRVDDYYPFGLTFNTSERTGYLTNKYLYNGKELQDELSLGWLDYGWRMYDPALARWNKIDRFAEKYYSETPYCYAINNPMLFVDVNGDTTSYYDTETGAYLGTLYGSAGMNDRTISSSEYQKLMNEKYLLNNVSFGSYNFYLNDPNKSIDDYLGTNDMEAYLNNADNVATSVLDLNSDVGELARIGYAEFRGGNSKEMEAGMDVTKNRLDNNYRGANSMNDVVNSPSQYSSLRSSDPNKPFYDNPYAQARQNSSNFNAWTTAVSNSIKVMNGGSGITQGAMLYYSPRSMPDGKAPYWHTSDYNVVNIPGTRTNYITVIKKK